MSDEEKKYFAELEGKIEEVERRLAHVNQFLEENKCPPVGLAQGQSLSKIWKKNIRQDIKDSGVRLFDVYLSKSVGLIESVKGYVSEFSKNFEIEKLKKVELYELELAQQVKTRKSERRDAWIAWTHKAARWVLGAAIAVVLYSFVACLAEVNDFIKVPLKDWFIS